MPAPILILFDIDGTLLSTGGAGRIALARSFEQVFGVSGMDAASRRVEYGGRTDPAILRDLAREAGLAAAIFEEHSKEFDRVYLLELQAEMNRADSPAHLLPGVAALIAGLSSRAGVCLALLTGNSESGARVKLERFGLNEPFPTGGFGSDHEDRREVAAVAHRRAEAHFGAGFPAEQVVVVGDTRHDVDCAHHHGFRCLAVMTGGECRDELARRGPAGMVEDLAGGERVFDFLPRWPEEG